MKTYWVIFNFQDRAGLGNIKIRAMNKDDARQKFLNMNIKHKEIIKIELN